MANPKDQKQDRSKTTVTTPEFRISYPKVFTPEINKLSKKSEYSIEALFPLKAEMGPLKAAAEAACIKTFGADKTKWPKNLRSPFRDQKEKAKDGKLPEGLIPGAVFMRFKCDSTKHKPVIVDQNVQPIIEESKFYAGGWARASVNAFAYSQGGNNGVSFGLNSLQFTKDDQPFSGRPSVEEAFEPIAGSDDEIQSDTDATSLF